MSPFFLTYISFPFLLCTIFITIKIIMQAVITMSHYKNSILKELHKKGISRKDMKPLLEDARKEIENEEANEGFSNFFFALRRHIIHRFSDFDFSFSDPTVFCEKDLFTPYNTWRELIKKINLRRDNSSDYSSLENLNAEFIELGNNGLPYPIKVLNSLDLTSNFDLGLNGFDYFLKAEIDDWSLIGGTSSIFLYKDTKNWIFLSVDEIYFAVDGSIYSIRKSFKYDSVNKIDLDIHKVAISKAEQEILDKHDSNNKPVEDTIELSVFYIGDFEPIIKEENPIFSRVSVKKKYSKKDFIGFYINTDSLNYQKFLYPRELLSDSEVFIQSVGYIDEELSYLNLGILQGSKDNVEAGYDFEDKLHCLIDDLAKFFSFQTGIKEYFVCKKELPLDFGDVRSKTIPSGLGRSVFCEDDIEYINDALLEAFDFSSKKDTRSMCSTRAIEIVSDEVFLKLLPQV